MKIWQKYEKYLIRGEWHIHTNRTDGDGSIEEYTRKAVKRGIPLIAFTEHVRRNLDYDFRYFLDEIKKARNEYNLIILSGCEVRVLPGGKLDVEDWILHEVDYPVFAFHYFSSDISEYLKSLKAALKNTYVNTWVHPGLAASKYGLDLSDEELIEVFNLMKEHNILLEVNSKHRLPPKRWVELAQMLEVRLVRGSDIHSVSELSQDSP